MKKKTKQQVKRVTLYTLIFVFVAGSFLLYLPLSQPAPDNTPVPLNDIPQINQGTEPTPAAP
jgi:hypothetical protein